MAIKETTVSIRTYYRLMKDRAITKIGELKQNKANLEIIVKELHDEVLSNKEIYKDNFKLDVLSYPEFIENKYISGKFLKVAKGIFINRGNNYEIVSDIYNILRCATIQKRIYDIDEELVKQEKLKNLTIKEYTEILRTYYNEVHKQLVLNGNGYAFTGYIGWICVNRVKIKTKRKTLDFAATKKREAELKAQGKRIYNKEEADWCVRNGIEYKAEDKRVFKKDEYYYEIPLLDSKLPNATKLKFELTDYRATSVRGKTNEMLIKECNSSTEEICKLPVSLKTKVTLCDQVDKILYTKFIRNEDQKSVAFRKVNSKN